MPKGNPSKQTLATEKYAKKVGIVSKSYRLRQELVEQFAKACEDKGEAQAAVLTRLMNDYISNSKM